MKRWVSGSVILLLAVACLFFALLDFFSSSDHGDLIFYLIMAEVFALIVFGGMGWLRTFRKRKPHQ